MTPLSDPPLHIEVQAEAPPQPLVVILFKVYCGIACIFYLCFVPVSWMFFLAPPEDMSSREADTMGIAFLVMAFVSLGLFVLPFCVETRPWVWVYGLVLICLGMTSTLCLPICVPLLIYWTRPDVKKYYGRG